MFWATRDKKMQPSNENNRPNLDARTSGISQLSKLTDELSAQDREGDDDDCQYCGSEEFEVKFVGGEKVLACGSCGRTVDERVDEKKEENRNAYSRFYT
jgi:DNA-directed RNA polymerase subunit RPC12/RpoP